MVCKLSDERQYVDVQDTETGCSVGTRSMYSWSLNAPGFWRGMVQYVAMSPHGIARGERSNVMHAVLTTSRSTDTADCRWYKDVFRGNYA